MDTTNFAVDSRYGHQHDIALARASGVETDYEVDRARIRLSERDSG